MGRLKHTRCAWCSRMGNYRYLEVMWRSDCTGPWSWCGGYACGACRNAWLSQIDQLGPGLVAWDG